MGLQYTGHGIVDMVWWINDDLKIFRYAEEDDVLEDQGYEQGYECECF